MGAYTTARRAAVTLADSARSGVGRAAYLFGLPTAHVVSTVAEWCGHRDAYELHRAILSAEQAVCAWAARRAPDGRVVAPEQRPCVEYRPEALAAMDLGAALQVELLAERVARLEARHPARVVERRRAPSPCEMCGSAVVEVLEGMAIAGDYMPALCAGCGQPRYAHKAAEVIP